MNIGDKWNGWTVESILGAGSYGKVYRVIRKEFGYTYESALKVMRIPQDKADVEMVRENVPDEESVREYFYGVVRSIVSEFEFMAEMRGHSNIVSYEDHSVTELKDDFGWEICVRMELLTPLLTVLQRRKLAIRDIIMIGIDICKALEMCQKYNIIHRDVKPQNMFVSKQGTYKLGDFGVARTMDNATIELSKKGTVFYMAPEVYKGGKYDSTVDIYSLGIVMYRLLNCNRMPFMPPYPDKISVGDTQAANSRRMSGETLPPPANATGRLAEIILKACAYDPKERYESARDMRSALESILYNTYEGSIIYPDGDQLPSGSSLSPGKDSGRMQSVQDPGEDETVPISTGEISAQSQTANPAKAQSPVKAQAAASTENSKSGRKLLAAAVVLALIVIGGLAIHSLHGGGTDSAGTENAGQEAVAPPTADVHTVEYTHMGISYNVPDDMGEDLGSEFAYNLKELDGNEERWYRYWYYHAHGEYPSLAFEVRRVGVLEDDTANEAYRLGPEVLAEDDDLRNDFELYARSFESPPENIKRGTVEIDGVTCWWVEYEQHGAATDSAEPRNAIKTRVLLIPNDTLQQITEVRYEYSIDNDEYAEVYQQRADDFFNSISIEQH